MRLVAEELEGERGGEIVFGPLDIRLSHGEALTITGPNGAGKSTLLRVLAGLLTPAAGTIRLDGADEDWPDPEAACHYLGHANAMKTALSVGENLSFWRDFLGAPRLSIDEALDMVGLPDIAGLPYGYLSTGQRRRAAIARLLTSHRPIWLLDEPTAGLDRAAEASFAELMAAHLQEGGMVVAATHLPLVLDDARELKLAHPPSLLPGGR